MARKPVIAANWKMHKTRVEATELTTQIVEATSKETDLPLVIVCPPFTALETVIALAKKSNIEVGAQNMDYRDLGAFTGEISAPMLSELGAKYVIVGHSERRQYFGDTNSIVNLKLKAALNHGLIPIVCVGESADERDNNLTDAVVRRQVAAAFTDVDADQALLTLIAYEPVWAIGTGRVCEASEANRVAKLIRQTLVSLYGGNRVADVVPVLYGGSVKSSNIDEQLEQSDIDGALVGGASLKFDEFMPLIKAGQKKLKLSASKA
jgi:triosephosphate isomerase